MKTILCFATSLACQGDFK